MVNLAVIRKSIFQGAKPKQAKLFCLPTVAVVAHICKHQNIQAAVAVAVAQLLLEELQPEALRAEPGATQRYKARLRAIR